MILLVDSNYICHYVMYQSLSLSYGNIGTGILFSFFRTVLTLQEKIDAEVIVFIWDSRINKRKKIYSDYKGNRVINPEALAVLEIAHEQFDALRTTLLDKFGFQNIFWQSGYEADDIIASIVGDVYGGPFFDGITIASPDKDLYQLLDENIQMYNPKTKKTYTDKNFREEYNIEPAQWSEVLAIAGCTTDNVKGINNIGVKRAIGYLNGTCKDWIKETVSSNEKIISRNRELVKLPFKGTKDFELKFNDKFYLDDFLDICEWYNFRSFTKDDNLDRWEKAFNME